MLIPGPHSIPIKLETLHTKSWVLTFKKKKSLIDSYMNPEERLIGLNICC